MATFIHVGRHWINLDLVKSVELFVGDKDPGRIAVARVNYVSGKAMDFRDPHCIEVLQAFLEGHEAT